MFKVKGQIFLIHAMKAFRGSRGITPVTLGLCTRDESHDNDICDYNQNIVGLVLSLLTTGP